MFTLWRLPQTGIGFHQSPHAETPVARGSSGYPTHDEHDAAVGKEDGLVLGHPWVVGELALGHLAQRHDVIGLLERLPQATVATDGEVMALINRHELYGIGIGYVDAQLLAATQLTGDAALWTADRRLDAAAIRIGCAIDQKIGAAEAP